MSIADLRREYNLNELRRRDLDPDPIVQFQRWFEQAATILGAESMDLNGVTLATADKDGRPSARIVLLKGLDQRGFIFFTNYDSRKGRELTQNPQAALVSYWSALERQVCVAGDVRLLPEAEAQVYFDSRPRGSQLAAWASRQSEVIRDRAELESQWQQLDIKYPQVIPKPPFWGGYILAPTRIEFWQGRPSRLHDCFRYAKQPDNKWLIERLSP
jgi:pyridoxamine 5'-phosphate oxidase